MFYFHHTLSTLLVYFLLLSASCHAIPTPYTLARIFRREDGSSSGVQMVTTITHIPTEAGDFIETCNIVLTPIQGDNGESMVREERTCTISLDSDSGAPPSTTTFGSKNKSLPVISLNPSAVNHLSGPLPTAVSVKGVSSVPNPDSTGNPVKEPAPPATNSSSNPKQSSSSAGSAKSHSNTNQSNPLSVSPAAAAAADAAESPFVPPGKKLSVLPIGLGIFAAISVIGLIIVIIVTYERTKHRKNFRKRKLAEAGANMGYGGMAQVQ